MRNRHGLNLTELMITVAIITVSASVAIPKFANSGALYRSQSAAKRIIADLAYAQTRARCSSLGQTVSFTSAGNSYSMLGIGNLTGAADTVVNLTNEPYQASISSAVFGSASSITFDRFGQPSSGGTIVVQSGNSISTVVVDAISGKGKLQ